MKILIYGDSNDICGRLIRLGIREEDILQPRLNEDHSFNGMLDEAQVVVRDLSGIGGNIQDLGRAKSQGKFVLTIRDIRGEVRGTSPNVPLFSTLLEEVESDEELDEVLRRALYEDYEVFRSEAKETTVRTHKERY